MLNFLENYEKSSDIVFLSYEYELYSKQGVKTVTELDGDRFKYVTKKYIYYTTNNILYRTDHNFDKKEYLFSWQSLFFIVDIQDDRYCYLKTIGDDGYYCRDIESGKTEHLGEVAPPKTYSFKNKDMFRLFGDILTITRKSDGETRQIKGEDIYSLDVPLKLKEISGSGWFIDPLFVGDDIYIQWLNNYTITVYKYDFETEKLEFVTWEQVYDIEALKTYYIGE